MLEFSFKKTRQKTAKIFKFIGTWFQFEDIYPGAILVGVPQKIEEE